MAGPGAVGEVLGFDRRPDGNEIVHQLAKHIFAPGRIGAVELGEFGLGLKVALAGHKPHAFLPGAIGVKTLWIRGPT